MDIYDVSLVLVFKPIPCINCELKQRSCSEERPTHLSQITQERLVLTVVYKVTFKVQFCEITTHRIASDGRIWGASDGRSEATGTWRINLSQSLALMDLLEQWLGLQLACSCHPRIPWTLVCKATLLAVHPILFFCFSPLKFSSIFFKDQFAYIDIYTIMAWT